MLSYDELLRDKNWLIKRVEIMLRDNYCCVNCDSPRPILHNIVNKHGIFHYSELESKGIDIILKATKDGEHFIYRKNQRYPQPGYYIGINGKSASIENTFFAYQIFDPNGMMLRYKALICFTEEIANSGVRTDLNIHHKYYIYGNMPWEYPDEALETLCLECHQKRHNEVQIPVYNKEYEILGYGNTCPKCLGSGYLPEFNYYMNGVCFLCSGDGVLINL